MMLHDRPRASSLLSLPRRGPRGRILSVACGIGLSLGATGASAQTPPPASATPATTSTATSAPATGASAEPQANTPQARAEALFDEGVTLLDAKSFAAACARFEESQKLDPAPGTLFNLATCEEGQAHFGTAARRWREGAALLPADDPRRPKAEKNAADAESKAAVTPGPDLPAPKAPPGPTATIVPAPTAPAPDTTTSVGFFSQHKASFATLGAGVALALGGTAVAVDIISGRYSAFVQKCAAGCTQADKDAMKGQQAAVNVLFGLAGAAGLTALGIFFFAERAPAPLPRTPAAPPRTQVSLSIGPMGGSITVTR